jgi:hypothetical protein
MTPADEIRAAAAKLRALATAAADNSGSSNWHTTRHFPDQPDSTFTTLWATGVRPLLGGGGRGRVPYVHAPVGDYAAAMDPATGLAFATLLEGVLSSAREASPAHEECDSWCSPETCDLSAALAVARAINAQP